jgi:threonine dehydratase
LRVPWGACVGRGCGASGPFALPDNGSLVMALFHVLVDSGPVLIRVPTRRHHTSAVCATAGNLGAALAYSGAQHGFPVTVFAAETANPLKVERMRSAGATVHLEGGDIERPRELARTHALATGSYLVEDSLDIGSCEGAGTIGLELVRAVSRLDVVLVALGGGALASGVGHVIQELTPGTEVVAIQPAGAPAMALSWRKRAVVNTNSIDTIADGVAGRYPIPEVLEDLLEVVDDVVLVDEDSIRAGMRQLFAHAGLVAEPSAALGVAAILENRERFVGRTVATVICGGNIQASDFQRWVLNPHSRPGSTDELAGVSVP